MTGIGNTLIIAGNYLFELIYLLIFVRVILSWMRPNPKNPLIRIVYNMTEPILEPFKRILHKFNVGGMIDFSPIFAILAIQFIVQPLYIGIVRLIF